MKRINPFVGLFVAIATLMTAFFVPVFVLLIDHGERLAAVEATVDAIQAEHGERLARVEVAIAALARDLAAVEAVQAEQGERLARVEAGIASLAGGLAATNERIARIEGTVAGALGRPLPRTHGRSPRRGRLNRATPKPRRCCASGIPAYPESARSGEKPS